MRRVIVVGAGIIGLCCAYELRRRGAAVTVLDKQDPGTGCSSGNSGWIVPSLSTPLAAPGLIKAALSWVARRNSPIRIEPRLDRALGGWLLEFRRFCNAGAYLAGVTALVHLNRRTFAFYDALQADGMEFEVHRSGLLFVFKTPIALGKMRDDMTEMAARCGYEQPRVLTADEMRGFEPGLSRSVCGGLFVAEERHVRPETLTAALVARLRDLNVDVHSRSAVTTMQARDAHVTVVTSDGESFEGDCLLIAAGVWSGHLGRQIGCPLPIQAGVGYSVTAPEPPGAIRHALYLFEAKVACSPFHDTVRIAGNMDLRGIDAAVDEKRIASLRRAAAAYLEIRPPTHGETAWMGMRPMLPDGLPVIGRAPRFDNVYFATGHGMLGVTLAPATAAALADDICSGRTDPDLDAFSPGRFTKRHSHAA